MQFVTQKTKVPVPAVEFYDASCTLCNAPYFFMKKINGKSLASERSLLTPRLVHWDIWDGNIFIENGELTGLIDWERCLWGDPLMEVGFRSYAQSPDFLNGYGIGELTEEENRRIIWYDLYLLMIVAQEHVYRKYETKDSYNWATTLLREKYSELKECAR